MDSCGTGITRTSRSVWTAPYSGRNSSTFTIHAVSSPSPPSAGPRSAKAVPRLGESRSWRSWDHGSRERSFHIGAPILWRLGSELPHWTGERRPSHHFSVFLTNSRLRSTSVALFLADSRSFSLFLAISRSRNVTAKGDPNPLTGRHRISPGYDLSWLVSFCPGSFFIGAHFINRYF